MAKARDAVKERYWRKVIRRQGASGLGVKQFCVREGLTEHQFHWWRRTLRQRDQHDAHDSRGAGTRNSQAAGKAGPVHGGGMPGGRLPSGHALGDGADNRGQQEENSAFLPVSLPLSLGAPIEVVHPQGHVIRVPAIFDSVALSRILAVLDASAGLSGEQ